MEGKRIPYTTFFTSHIVKVKLGVLGEKIAEMQVFTSHIVKVKQGTLMKSYTGLTSLHPT